MWFFHGNRYLKYAHLLGDSVSSDRGQKSTLAGVVAIVLRPCYTGRRGEGDEGMGQCD